MVIIVLLKVAFTCATPEAMFLRSRRRTRRADNIGWDHRAELTGHPTQVHPPALLFLAGNRLGRTLAGAGVGMGALAADRQPAAVTQPTIAAEIHQPLDVHGDLTPEVAFHHIVMIDDFANLQHLLIGQLGHAPGIGNSDFPHDFTGLFRPNAVDILQSNNYPLIRGYVDTGYACHGPFTPAIAGSIGNGRERSEARTQTITT